MKTFTILSLCLLLLLKHGYTQAQDVRSNPDGKVEVPRRVVLTGNADAGELGLDVGVTYAAEPTFSNPQDPEHKRLIDSDKPVANWNTVAGINAVAQTVTFDLQKPYALDEVALHFRRPQKPATITISIATQADGPWREMGAFRLEEQPDEWWRLRVDEAQRGQTIGRFVKLDFKIKEWGWYLDEVKIYGLSTQQAHPLKRMQNQLILAEQGKAHAAIVLADRTYPNALRAAQLFQTLAQQMTGAQLPIVPESQFNSKSTAILIGDSTLARKHGVKVEQTPFGDDRYVLRGGGKQNFITLVGNDAPYGDVTDVQSAEHFRGSLFAVYDFFERQGCGWYGPDELWQVVPKVNQLKVSALNVEEVPAFKFRRIWMNGLPRDSWLRDAWRQGGTEIAASHAFDHLVPPGKYKAEHPEWFGEGQPDITHPEVIRIAVDTLSSEVQSKPHHAQLSFSVSANDVGGYKEKPFKNVGNIAAQQLYFANEVAEGLRARHPDRHFNLGMLAYWHSHDGPVPMLKAEPEVVVILVNEGNHAKPLEWPESEETARTTGRNNTRELRAIAQWQKTGGLKGMYEWWIPVIGNKVWEHVPWYDGDTAVRNLRFWHRNGIRYVDYESQREINAGFPLRWAQYYIGARASWNPNIDPSRELLIACRKLFGAAGERMWEYYRLQEKAMRETREHVGNWALPLPHLLYSPEIEQRGVVLLQQAMALAIGQQERARIDVEMKQWQCLRDTNATARAAQAKVFKVIMNGIVMNWNEQTINIATVRDLSDLPPDTPIEVVEADGQNRLALPGETYDLNSGVTFRTARPRE